jgi:hypothetical protein
LVPIANLGNVMAKLEFLVGKEHKNSSAR